jgi:hypothetical protein
MTTYESDIKTISSSEEVVFGILSDLNNLEKLNNTPSLTDKIKDLKFDVDSCTFSVDGFGKVGFRILERNPFNLIKMVSENAPVRVSMEFVICGIAENQSTLKLVLLAELPAMIKMMVGNKLQDGVNAIAELLAKTLNQ